MYYAIVALNPGTRAGRFRRPGVVEDGMLQGLAARLPHNFSTLLVSDESQAKDKINVYRHARSQAS